MSKPARLRAVAKRARRDQRKAAGHATREQNTGGGSDLRKGETKAKKVHASATTSLQVLDNPVVSISSQRQAPVLALCKACQQITLVIPTEPVAGALTSEGRIPTWTGPEQPGATYPRSLMGGEVIDGRLQPFPSEDGPA